MEMDNVSRIWKEKKVKLKGKYPIITDNDLRYRQGEENEMMKVLRTKLGKTHQELLKIIIML